MLVVKPCGLRCRLIVASCFWNITSFKNGDSLLGAEDSGKGKQAPLKLKTMRNRNLFPLVNSDIDTGDSFHIRYINAAENITHDQSYPPILTNQNRHLKSKVLMTSY